MKVVIYSAILFMLFFPTVRGLGNGFDQFIYLPITLHTYPTKPKIAFISERDGNREIYTVSYDGTGLSRITNNTAMDFGLRWSPDGSRIAYYSDQDGNWEIYTVTFIGSDIRRLTDNGSTDYSPSWSPDGLRIVFTSNRTGYYEVYSMKADGTDQIQLTNLGSGSQPLFSPDGTRIAFTVSGEIFVMDEDGSDQTKITSKADVYAYDFDWSPDSMRIVFRGELPGNQEIYVVNADGSGLKNLTKSYGVDLTPNWSPDGTKIAYTCAFSLCIMNPDGSEKKVLTYNTDQYPDWSPDSKQIVFSYTVNGNAEIYTISVDGTGLTRLTDHPAVDYRPVWQP